MRISMTRVQIRYDASMLRIYDKVTSIFSNSICLLQEWGHTLDFDISLNILIIFSDSIQVSGN